LTCIAERNTLTLEAELMAAIPRNLQTKPASPLMVRLDAASKTVLALAADLRRISVSDYVRTITVAQARREVQAAGNQVLALTPEEQLAFWTALREPPRLTKRQKELGRLMRGES
jgi:uncharacterized protein (DUF1778 family)